MAEKITTPEGEELPEDKGEGGDGSPAETKKTEGEEEKKEEDNKPIEEDVEVATRNKPSLHNQQGFAMRKNKEVEKLKSEKDDDGGDKGGDDEEEGELTKEAKLHIGREVAKHLAPVADEQELNKLFIAEPEAKKYEKQIKKYMNHPAYEDIPASVIYHHLAFEKAAGMGAKMRSDADREAGHSRTKGSSRRQLPKSSGELPSAEEIESMSNEDFENLQNKVKSGRF